MYNINNISRSTWGFSAQNVKQIYIAVFEKIVIYREPIWFKNNVKLNNKLLQIQQVLMINITKCSPSVETESPCVLRSVYL